MPTYKYRSFEAAADALLLRPAAGQPAARIRALFDLSRRLAPPRRRTGVFKYRSFEEAEADRYRPDGGTSKR
jgi:hypothetical protein